MYMSKRFKSFFFRIQSLRRSNQNTSIIFFLFLSVIFHRDGADRLKYEVSSKGTFHTSKHEIYAKLNENRHLLTIFDRSILAENFTVKARFIQDHCIIYYM